MMKKEVYKNVTIRCWRALTESDPKLRWRATWGGGYRCYGETQELAVAYAKEWIDHLK